MFGLLALLPGVLNGVLGYLNKKHDTALEQFRIGNTNGKDVSVAVIQAEIARQSASKETILSGMNHPIWWLAWGLGVFPVLTYHAAIFFVSTFPMWGWTILKVPASQEEFSRLVVGSIFGLTGASMVVTGLAKAWTKRV